RVALPALQAQERVVIGRPSLGAQSQYFADLLVHRSLRPHLLRWQIQAQNANGARRVLERFLTCPPYPNVLQTCDHLGTHRAYFPILAASALMKNFLRALRYAWPYRGRLIFSVICAVMAA